MSRPIQKITSLIFKGEVQGLRAVSVSLVVLFHLGLTGLQGGYIGVDVFFVISGYLITGKLIREYQASNTINFISFYSGRAWRLMPALFVTIFLTFAIAAIIMTPSTLKPMAGSAIASLIYVSNIFFWQQSGYFDASAITKPLLHIWSLSIEEQFYFLWPFVLLVSLKTARTRGPHLMIAFTALLSYALVLFYHQVLAILPLDDGWIRFLDMNAANTKFFWLPFRLFEFALGASILFFPALDRSKNRWKSVNAQLTGLALVLLTATLYNERTDGPYMIIPCLGGMLVIVGGNNGKISRLLINPIFLYLGSISYSLYLVHWPAIVFYRYLVLRPMNGYETPAITIAMIAIADLMYRFIEQPFRNPNVFVFRNFGLVKWLYCAAISGAAISVLTAASVSGWPWRYGPIINNYDISALRDEGLVFSNRNHVDTKPFAAGHKILIVGDSHGGDVANGLFYVLGSEYSIRYISISSFCLQYLPDRFNEGMIDPNCKGWLAILSNNSGLIAEADRVIMTFDWLPVTTPAARHLIAYIKQKRIPLEGVLLLGSDIHYPNFPEIALRQHNVTLTNGLALDIDSSEKVSIDQQLKTLATSNGILFERKIPLMCGPRSCDFVAADSSLNVWDEAHWTLQGSRIFMARLVKKMPEFFYVKNDDR